MNGKLLTLIRTEAVPFMPKEGRNQSLLCVLTVANLDTLFWDATIISTLMLLLTASLLCRNHLLILTTVTMEVK